MLTKVIGKIKAHKIITTLLILILIGGGYYGYLHFTGSSSSVTRYVLAKVEKGTIITSISGSGQVSASNQVDLSPKASGDVTYVGVTAGQTVKAGTLIARLDATTAVKAVRDAQANLDSAKLALQKLQQPTDQLSLLQAQNALTQAQQSKQNATDDLAKTYSDGFTTISNAFLQLPNVMTNLNSTLFSYDFTGYQQNLDYYRDSLAPYSDNATQYRDDVYNAYQKAKAAYDQSFADYKAATRYSDTTVVDSLINETYTTAKNIANAIKSFNNLIQLYEDKLTEHNLKPVAMADTQLASLNTWTGQVNTHISNLLNIQNTIKTDQQTLVNSDRTIAEKTASLAELQAGTDPLDIKSQQLSIQQKINALQDANQQLANYYVYAPFDGVIAAVDVAKGDAASSGTVVATLITQKKIATVSLNEVDVAKVKVGQKATLTFDAVSDLSISGEVIEVDTLGTVTQGVVNYGVKIGFDTQDERIKSGMSVSATIITESKQDVLLISGSAVKSSGQESYVLVPDETVSTDSATDSSGVILQNSPRQQVVQTGLSDDNNTEITSGLAAGDLVIIKTVSSSTTSSATTKTSSVQSLLGGGGGGPPN